MRTSIQFIFGLLAVSAALLFVITPGYADHRDPEVIAIVDVGARPFGVGVNPRTNRIYVANHRDDSVSVIDGETNTVVANVGVSAPWDVAVDPLTNRIYVSKWRGGVAVIDGWTNTVIDYIGGNCFSAVSLDLNPVTNRIYVSDYGECNLCGPQTPICYCCPRDVHVIDGSTNSWMGDFPARDGSPVAVNPLTNRIYVNGGWWHGWQTAVIDGETHATLATIPYFGPDYLAVNPCTNRIYASDQYSTELTVIDGETNTIIETIGSGGASALGVNVYTNRVYAWGYDHGYPGVLVIDGLTNSVVASVDPGSFPSGIAVNPVTDRIYMTHGFHEGTVSVIEGFHPMPKGPHLLNRNLCNQQDQPVY